MTSNASEKGQEILIMNIDIGDGRFGQITVHEEDEPEDLAEKFCEEHGLDAQLKQALVAQIEQHIDELVQEQQVSTLDEGEEEVQVMEPRKEVQPQFSHQPVINANSRAMARGRDQMNVYDRLHSLAKKPKAAPEPEVHQVAEPKRLSPSKVYPFKNPGHKLYYKGLKMKEDTEVQCVQIKQIQQTQQEQELTFKPQINPNAAKLAKRTGGSRPEDVLLRKGLQTKEAIARKREEKEKQTMQHCKFVPGIDKRCFSLRSSRIGTKVVRSRSQDAFQGLYEEAQKRKERHEQTFSEIQNSECPFRPKVNEVLRSKFSGSSFLERQMEYQKANEESMEL